MNLESDKCLNYHEDGKKSDLPIKDCEDKYDIILKEHGNKEKAGASPKEYEAEDPDILFKKEGGKLDVLLEDGVKGKTGVLSENDRYRKELDLHLKDCEDRNKCDMVLEHCRARPKTDSDGYESPLFLKDSEDGDKHGVVLKYFDGLGSDTVPLEDCKGDDEPYILSNDDNCISESNILFKKYEGGDQCGESSKDCENVEEPIVLLTGHEQGNNPNVMTEKSSASRSKHDHFSDVCEGGEAHNVLLQSYNQKIEEPDTLLKYHKCEGVPNALSKYCSQYFDSSSDESEPNKLLKDFESSDNLFSFSKFPEGKDVVSDHKVSSRSDQRDKTNLLLLKETVNEGKPDEPSNDSNILLKKYDGDKLSVSSKDCKGRDDILSDVCKGEEAHDELLHSREKPDALLKYHKDEDVSNVFLKDGIKNKAFSFSKFPESEEGDFLSGDCKVGEEENFPVLLKDKVNEEKLDQQSSCQGVDNLYILLKELEGAEEDKADNCLSKDCGDERESVRLLKDYDEGEKQFSLNKFKHDSQPILASKDCEVNDKLHILLRDLEGRDELDLSLKDPENAQSTTTCTPCGAQEVPTNKKKKNKRKKKNPKPELEKDQIVSSASLYQSYLNMVKKTPLTMGKIEPPSLINSRTISEHGETFNANTTQPIALSKKSNEKEVAKKLFKNHFHQRKTVLRRDSLAESSEIIVSLFETYGRSEKLFEYLDSQAMLNRSEPNDFNEMSKSKEMTPYSSPRDNKSSEVTLKRSAEHTPLAGFRIPKKRKLDSHTLKKIQSRHDFQLVIMKDPQGSPMKKVDLDEVHQLLNEKVMNFVLQKENPCFVPRFFGFNVDHNHKWLVLNCKDRDTMKWILKWKPVSGSTSFTILKSKEAPWRSIRVCFTIKKDKPEEKRVIGLLASQNRTLNVADWAHIKTSGRKGEWTLYFLLTKEESKQLEEVGWAIFFELGMLQVLKL